MAETIKVAEAPQIPSVELGGKYWELRFSHKAMRRFCSLAKCKMNTFDNALNDYDNYAKLIWTCIWAQDEKVTLDQVNEWLDALPTMGDVIELTQQIIAAAMKKPVEAEKQAEESEDDEGNPTGETTSI